MARLIDANTLKAEFTGNFHENWHYTAVRAMIDVAPTVDAVEVVHCKDCKYWYQIGNDMCCEHWDFSVTKADDYCSRGERRDNV